MKTDNRSRFDSTSFSPSKSSHEINAIAQSGEHWRKNSQRDAMLTGPHNEHRSREEDVIQLQFNGLNKNLKPSRPDSSARHSQASFKTPGKGPKPATTSHPKTSSKVSLAIIGTCLCPFTCGISLMAFDSF